MEGSAGLKGVWESAGIWAQVGTHYFHCGWYPVYEVLVLSPANLQRTLSLVHILCGSSEQPGRAQEIPGLDAGSEAFLGARDPDPCKYKSDLSLTSFSLILRIKGAPRSTFRPQHLANTQVSMISSDHPQCQERGMDRIIVMAHKRHVAM